MGLLAAFVSLLFCYSLVSRRLEQTIVTAPIVFAAAGMLVGSVTTAVIGPTIGSDAFLRLAEIGLVLLLFTDASRTDLNVLRNIRSLPMRLLSAGMLLTIVLGAVAALIVFPHLTIWEAGILAAILAPTDAGLGQVIVNSPRVPLRIRQALNVEAGLNDGLSVPFLLFFIALATAGGEGRHRKLDADSSWTSSASASWSVSRLGSPEDGCWPTPTGRSGWRNSFRQVGLIALPVLCLLGSEMAGASMFIAAFVAGLAVQIGFRDVSEHSLEFAEEWGQVLNFPCSSSSACWWRNNGSRSTRRRCCTRCSA